MQEHGFSYVPDFWAVTICSPVDTKVSKEDVVTIFRDEVYRLKNYRGLKKGNVRV